MFAIIDWILEHKNWSLAILAGLAIVTFAFFNPAWWGERALGVIIGVASLIIIVMLILMVLDNTSIDETEVMPWVLVIVPTGTALIVRAFAGYRLVWPIQVQTPTAPRPESLILILGGIFLLLLLVGFVRAVNRGEGVAVESHWGGLGGGIGGFQLSTPLIYLLGIVFVLAVTSAVAWAVYKPAEGQASQQQNQRQQAASTKSGADDASPAASPTQSASPSPSPTASQTP